MKKNFSRAIIITSCIKPNTKVGNVSNFSLEKRALELINNIKEIYKSKLFSQILVIDASPTNSFPKNQSLKIYLKKLGGLDVKEIKYICFKPNKKLKDKILIKGAGLSETKMLIYGIKKIKNKENTIIFKLSGRYLVKNLFKVINNIDKVFSDDVHFCMPISNLFLKTSSIFYAFNKKFPYEIFEQICKKVSDKEGLYIEHLFYSEIFLNSFIKTKRMKELPIYPYQLYGGHNQGKYSITNQTIKNIILKYL